ncbi:Helicase associated domain protein [Mycolicibacterium smegmatis]|uniref:DEAD/DEAH box helicase n=1 Tax=Mycolicibacterium smegmatis TaxID=1772 RepID=UPI0005D7B621|nr:DEAD/DEAH box helicase [Mycolicibacterium smegmatis]MDF1899718.1 Helicase associated domain protein [Mycolicibacterium smegmatis]MDF1905506.1 Helicase associated domain protein [Mycolicibacterium smegmatis]MDF1917895.1 Helicase associated domain protein [Mycolicibacterium smegmatis]MDF1924549.1 Helicase associated domain protein [Mycolicibacterium smegmatis]UAK57720.1 Helicase associated domain protein [Mycolicibacterium smegmatis]
MGGTFSDLKAQFDPVNRKRKGDQFEIVCKWFLENDTGQYKQLLRRVWLWKDWPGNWGIDAGIDLVAEDTEGRLWAIQAKAYENTVTRTEVNKFLAEAGRFDFAYRMLMATTDKLSPTAQRTMEDLGVTFIGLTELEDFTEWPAKLTDLRPARVPEPREPHDYQQDAIRDVIEGFKTADRGQLIMACGTGKTLTAWFIKEELAATRTLVLVPSLSLLKQTMKEWRTANIKRPFDALPVCSDETVALDEDAAISHTSYLGEPADTDPEVIAAFLRKRSGPRVVFATYQSSPQIAAAFKLGRVPQFDLVIADEAHRVAGPVSSDFGTVLNPKAIRAKRRLFMTATPRYFTGRILRQAQEADYEVASMDDQIKFGNVFHRLSFAEAIERKLLTDYQVAIIGVDDATYRDWAKRGLPVRLSDETPTDARSLAGQIGLAKAMRKYDLRRLISFHSRVRAARKFAESMPGVLEWMPARQRPRGSLWSQHASGEMSAGERHVLLQHLKRLGDGERGLLANARCLAEGVDVPSLDGVAFIDPRRSEVDIVQAVGRAIRKSETKTIGTVVIPVFIDPDEDADAALDSSAFKPVWDVIKALRAHDTELGEHLDALRREMGRKGSKPRLPSKIHFDVPATVGTEFVNAFKVHMVDATTAPWEFWFGLLTKHVAEHGHARPSYTSLDGDNRLAAWVTKQRSHRNSGKLSQERQLRLEELSGWTWNPRDDLWEEGFARLQDYVAQSGTALISKDATVNGFQVGAWVTTQRSAYKKGGLPAERIQRLEALPGWTWSTRDDKWPFWYEQLKKYVAEHGHTRLAALEKYDGLRLGQWVAQQRYHRNRGDLDPARARLLEEFPDWTWDALTDQWEQGFRHLQEYVQRHGDAMVAQKFKSAEGYKLGQWATIQRTVYRDGQMSKERQARLEALPGWAWEARESRWEEGFRRLQAYTEAHGTARLVRTYVDPADGYQLGKWAYSQRSSFSRGRLGPDRTARLEALPGWVWGIHDALWEGNYQKLAEYAAAHGSCAPTKSSDSDGFRIGGWVNQQRTLKNKGKLRADYAARLEALPGWVWAVNDSKWEEGFRQLVDYTEHHGTAQVPARHHHDGYPLGSWVPKQRDFYRAGTLSEERARRLEALPGWSWDPHAEKWERAFMLLREYTAEHGTSRVPQSYTVDGVRLGFWIATQKGTYAKGRLDPARQRRLEELPGWTWTTLSHDVWEERFVMLEKFTAREGHARVPQRHVEQGVRLGQWVSVQRHDAVSDVIAPERRERLEALPGWAWDSKAAVWDGNLALFVNYVKQHKTDRIPRSEVVNGVKLGQWVHVQRRFFAQGKLSRDRQKRLEAVPHWAWE